MNLKTAIIEKDQLLGGTCLHRGCIPTKFLLHVSKKFKDLHNMHNLGMFCKDIEFKWDQIMAYKNSILSKHASGVESILSSQSINIYHGKAKLSSIEFNKNVIEVESSNSMQAIVAKNVIFAVGSKTKNHFNNTLISGNRIMNSDDILNISEVPKSIVIVGGGVVGCEFASVFKNFASEVTILENTQRILPMVNYDCSQGLRSTFDRLGIHIETNVKVKSITEESNSVTVTIDDSKSIRKITADYCLIATGREADIHNLFSDNISMNIKKNLLANNMFRVNKFMETSVKGLYAIGDCINTPWLAHTASAEALTAVSNILKFKFTNSINYNCIPMCVYTIPSIAWCGLGENDKGISREYTKTYKFPLSNNSVFSFTNSSNGFIKIIADCETNEVLGVHILGVGATELIAEASLAIQIKATVDELLSVIHAHPTLYESISDTLSITKKTYF
jgi:dihydrolipoamide dehydrogenase